MADRQNWLQKLFGLSHGYSPWIPDQSLTIGASVPALPDYVMPGSSLPTRIPSSITIGSSIPALPAYEQPVLPISMEQAQPSQPQPTFATYPRPDSTFASYPQQPTFASYGQPPTAAVPSPASQAYGPPNWLALGDQRREAAYNPIYDANDPRNIKAVDASGRANALASIDDLIKRLIAQGVISG